MTSSKPYLRAIGTNLMALQAILAPVMEEVDYGLKAAGQGNQNGAVGAIIVTDSGPDNNRSPRL